MAYFRFEKFACWVLAREFVSDIYKITRKFPKEELFGLVSQMRRAATSIMLNIAEGSDRGSDKEFKRFLFMSLASLEEVVASLYVAFDQKFITDEEFKFFYNKADMLAAKINAFIKKLDHAT